MAILVQHQLELLGRDETIRWTEESPTTPGVKTRVINRINRTHDLLASVATKDDLTFNHSGLCQTFLPHSRLRSNQTVWKRQSGKFTLMVTPGVLSKVGNGRRPNEASDDDYVGVPYGAKARLIMLMLQTEGLKCQTVSLGKNLTAFMRSLGLPCTGGSRGTIAAVSEQCIRIARCNFTMQWTERDQNGVKHTTVADTRIVDGMHMWEVDSGAWTASIRLGDQFYNHLREHAVPLDKRSIALLSGNSLALDLYALFAYRLPKLTNDTHVSWERLLEQVGSNYKETFSLARKVREIFPEVMRAYPHAKVEVTRWGLNMRPSKPSVPRSMVAGYRVPSTG